MDYEIRQAVEAQMDEILDIQTEAFLYREPMTMALGMDEEGYRKNMRWMFEQSIRRGGLLVAVEQKTGKVIGLNATYPSNFLDTAVVPQELLEGYEKVFEASGDLLERIDRKLEERPAYKAGKYLHMYYTATHKNYGRCGIATALAEAALAYAKEQGYTHIYAETTNPKSLSVLLHSNGEIVDRVEYAACGIKAFEHTEGELVLVVKEL